MTVRGSWIWDALFGWLPRGVQLSDNSFARRHRSMRIALWVEIAIVVGLIASGRTGLSTVLLFLAALVGAACDLGLGERRIRAVIVVGALVACDEALIMAVSHRAEAELALLVGVVGAALYQSWRPFMLAYFLVIGHYLVISGDHLAWRLADCGFVTIAALVQLSLWRSMETARLRSRAVQAAVLEAEERQLRVRAELADRKREAVQKELADLVLRAELSAELEQMVQALEASGESVAGHAEKAQQVMNEFMQAIVNINYAVMDGETTWSVAHDRTMLTEETIDQLSVASNSIVDIAEEIQDIASKTRMLSFNAAIEAARAGEAGRGFGVVAEEVRSLAGKVGHATARITQVVTGIQSGAAAAQGAISEINQVVAQARESQRTISQAVELQTLAAEQASKAIASLHADARTMGGSSAAAGAPVSDGEPGSDPAAGLMADIWL